MTISDRINKKFNSHGVTIEESIKNAQVSGETWYEKQYDPVTLFEGPETAKCSPGDSGMQIDTILSAEPTSDKIDITIDGKTITLSKSAEQETYWANDNEKTFLRIAVTLPSGVGVTIHTYGDYHEEYTEVPVQLKVENLEEKIVPSDNFTKAVEFVLKQHNVI